MSDDYLEHLTRHRTLVAEHGKPTPANCGSSLRILGLRDTVHPDDAVALVYPTRDAAEAFAASNLEHEHLPSLGITQTSAGWIGVTDLRPPPGYLVTDPAAADDGGQAWRKEQRKAS
jgi:hypothetical protein